MLLLDTCFWFRVMVHTTESTDSLSLRHYHSSQGRLNKNRQDRYPFLIPCTFIHRNASAFFSSLSYNPLSFHLPEPSIINDLLQEEKHSVRYSTSPGIVFYDEDSSIVCFRLYSRKLYHFQRLSHHAPFCFLLLISSSFVFCFRFIVFTFLSSSAFCRPARTDRCSLPNYLPCLQKSGFLHPINRPPCMLEQFKYESALK